MANSTIERLLQDQYGDLHDVIPRMAEQHGQEKTAYLLGVTQRWVSRWLKNHGYVQETRWIRVSPEAQ